VAIIGFFTQLKSGISNGFSGIVRRFSKKEGSGGGVSVNPIVESKKVDID
jgi:hypothetical protein